MNLTPLSKRISLEGGIILSKWTKYQLLVSIIFIALIMMNHQFSQQIRSTLTWVQTYIEPSLLIMFFTIILVIWGFTILLLLQEKKNRYLFSHRIWRIMPAISGVIFLLSMIAFIVLGITVFSELKAEMYWILDVMIIYFLVLFDLFILSVILRYGKADTHKNVITKSANYAVLILFVILFLI